MKFDLGKYRKHAANQNAHIWSLRLAVGVLLILSLLFFWGWKTAPKRLMVHMPPDLTGGTRILAGEIGSPNVYAFGSYIFQQLNRWRDNGQKDYGENIQRLSVYLTDSYKANLIAEQKYKGSRGELSQRTRMVYEPPGHGYDPERVDVVDKNTWVIWLDLRLQENVRGMNVKDVLIRYPLRVVRVPGDWERNPWGLALDDYWIPSYRLTDEQLTFERENNTMSKTPMKPKKEGNNATS